MRLYTNGVNLNIADAVRIDFKDNNNGVITNVTGVAMTFETFKMVTDAFNNAVTQHEETLAKLEEAARKAN